MKRDSTGPQPSSLPIAVLVSGGGTNLQALLDTVHTKEAEVVAVASNTPSAPALDRARQRGIQAKAFPRASYPDRDSRDQAMAEWVSRSAAKLVVLAGYSQLLGQAFLKRFPGAVINVHPSLLPSFPGLGAIDQALAYGVKVFGVTVHFVDDGMDTGAVILQGAIPLPDADDPAEVLRALRPLEHTLLPEAVRLIARGQISVDPENPRRIVIAR